MDPEEEKTFGLYATISRLSHHCFRLCDNYGSAAEISQGMNVCVGICVKNAIDNKNYVSNRFDKEFPESKKHNKSLEFTNTEKYV